MTVHFVDSQGNPYTPSAVATQIGQGAWTSVSPASSFQISLQGNADYGVAYVCQGELFLLELTTTTDPSPTLTCTATTSPSWVPVSVTYNASSISNASSAVLYAGSSSYRLSTISCSSCKAQLPQGTYDVVLMVENTLGQAVGFAELQNQALTSTTSLSFGSILSLTPYAVSVGNIPPNFQGALSSAWVSSGGTLASLGSFSLSSSVSVPQISASGHEYLSGFASSNPSQSPVEIVGAIGPLTSAISFPPIFDPQVNTSSALPTFSLLNASGASFYDFNLNWGNYAYSAVVAPAWLGSSTSYTLPNLSNLNGFSAYLPPSGTTVRYEVGVVDGVSNLNLSSQSPFLPSSQVTIAGLSGSYVP